MVLTMRSGCGCYMSRGGILPWGDHRTLWVGSLLVFLLVVRDAGSVADDSSANSPHPSLSPTPPQQPSSSPTTLPVSSQNSTDQKDSSVDGTQDTETTGSDDTETTGSKDTDTTGSQDSETTGSQDAETTGNQDTETTENQDTETTEREDTSTGSDDEGEGSDAPTDLEAELAGTTAVKWEMNLTPYWHPLRFAEGETVEIDCGVTSSGGTGNEGTDITWVDPAGRLVTGGEGERVSSLTTAHGVKTLRIQGVTLDDSGAYVCNVTASKYRNITFDVVSSKDPEEVICGFESPSLCGWTVDNTSSVTSSWRWVSGDDDIVINRSSKGPRYDHTYGSSKHIGHFMDIDFSLTTVEKPVASLLSPEYIPHDDSKCLQFWYIFRGGSNGSLDVLLRHVTDNQTERKDSLDYQTHIQNTKEWQLGRVDLEPQTQGYKIIFAATLSGNGKNVVVGLDDVRMVSGTCADNENDDKYFWPDNSLLVRLVGENGPDPELTEGRVEVLHDGRWGTVCSSGFGKSEASVVCNSLGLSGDGVVRNQAYSIADASVPIWLHELKCEREGQTDLGSCLGPSDMWGEVENCTHKTDAGVQCVAEATTTAAAPKTATAMPATTTTKPSTTTTTTSTTTTPSTTTTTVTPSTTKATTTTAKTTTTTTTAKPTPSSTQKTTTRLPTTTTSATTTKQQSSGGISLISTTTAVPVEGADSAGNSAGVAIGIAVALVVVATGIIIVLMRRKKKGRKNAYITFGNPSYSKEHLPANDFGLESPLTLSSNGYSVLA